jgi:hypothetical protein
MDRLERGLHSWLNHPEYGNLAELLTDGIQSQRGCRVTGHHDEIHFLRPKGPGAGSR